MTTDTTTVDRSADLSQPLANLGPDETLKYNSDYLRGSIDQGLLDRITGGVTFEDNKLMKFHGIYQQDDRDVRDERRRQKLEPAFTFMVRVRLPGGVCTPAQWLKIDELARAHGGDQIRLTTRQTFQFHWVVKEDLKPTIQGLHDVLLDTIAACGDDARTVMATANPEDSALHAEVAALSKQLSDHVIPPITKSGTARSAWRRRKTRSHFTGAPIFRGSSRSASWCRRRTTSTSTRRTWALSPFKAPTGGWRASTSRSAAAWAGRTTSPPPIRGSAT
jgi:hypothetical protein